MNALETFILENKLDPQEAMDRLQNHGIVSDNCIWADSVAKADQAAAIAFLEKNPAQQPL